MKELYYLNYFIRYRQEGRKVLLTNCATLENYIFPKKTLKIFNLLQNGYDISLLPKTKFYQDLKSDLLTLDIISKQPSMKISTDLFSKMERY